MSREAAVTGYVDLVDLAGRGPVHFVGVGGAGMYALAELLLRAGGSVTGCDLKENDATRRLASLGASVERGHDPDHVEEAAAVVVTSAVPPDHPELRRAREREIPVLKRASALAGIVNRGRLVAVAGTHGKTSTTAMTAEVLAAGGLDPTALVGGAVIGWEGHLRRGSDRLHVVEADEYDRSFHTLEPDVAVVTNLEADHLDVYGDLEGVRSGFRTFVEAVAPEGRVVLCADNPGASALVTAASGSVRTYGTGAGSQLRAVDLRVEGGRQRFEVVEDGEARGTVELGAPGRHTVLNALAAAACARVLGVAWDRIRRGLADFRGVERRFERLGEAGGVVVIDDYAHHPTEIEVTLEAVRALHPERRLVAVFQPHLYTRTRDFAPAFGEALAAADVVWITDVFPAREEPIPGVTGETVTRAAREARTGEGTEVRYHEALEGLAERVAADVRPGDAVVVMGAGSVECVGTELLKHLAGAGESGEASDA